MSQTDPSATNTNDAPAGACDEPDGSMLDDFATMNIAPQEPNGGKGTDISKDHRTDGIHGGHGGMGDVRGGLGNN
jgi:hypothetical protein